MNTINIYLTKQQRQKIDKMKVKYKLSLTTIVDIICEITNQCLWINGEEKSTYDMFNRNLYKREGKTSIKEPLWIRRNKLEHPNRYVNNCLQAYLRNEIHLFVQKTDSLEGKHGYWNAINQELLKREDNWWEYNRFIRMQKRNERENKK